ncbi:hypothetical protein SAMN05428959_10353 [Duganella sp. CF517]|uniref:hypothetical protein n=1 Tax=Duganella sp. CF517 TaxID=1881038 RepID=UPI0008D53B16|nr:hypothetical protein [Duganella sp. CF517]SEN77269.1 hypothetical protein SAMN05428959_10353 [Duganella sp. CF517]
MSAPLTIGRLAPDPDGLDFAALQQAGLAFVQELAGKQWTDFNAHDPGVTILDQLCYALTDLAYRSSLPHEDYLAAGDGAIDLRRHALHRPQDIFPSEPVTDDDWRRLLYDRVPEIDDVWFDQLGAGLVDIKLKACDEPGGANLAPAAVRRIFAANRALCQDIASVTVLRTRNFYLGGDIEVRSLRDAAEVYADIVFQCAQQVGSGLQLHDYDHAAGDTPALDELFSGPFTEHGLIRAEGRRHAHAAISTLRLIGVIRGIEGVRKVHRLEVLDENGEPLDSDPTDLPPGEVPRIPLDQQHGSRLNLHFMSKSEAELGDADDASGDGAPAVSNAALRDAARPHLNKLKFERRTVRERKASLEHLVTEPRGSGVALDHYYSIQHQFPAIYGINAYGVPASAPPETRAAARQLKAYLYIFEQTMANYVHGLANIGQLFSTQRNARRSYYTRPITDAMLPDIESLYTMAPDGVARQLEQIRQCFDPHEDRRERVLDVMLAMYGEVYTQQSLRKFNFYFTTRRAMRAWLLENKRAFLVRIAALGKHRAAGFRYDLPAWDTDNVSGAHRKIAILLGLHSLRCCRPLCGVLRRHGLRIVERGDAGGATFAQLLERLDAPATTPELRVPRALLHQAFPHDGNSAPADVTVLTPAQQRRLRLLNMKSEGFHLIEHTLLRPRQAAAPGQPTANDDFHNLQVSVVFPDWTVRFASPEFRKLAQETVSLNLPAHVMPHFYWLGHDDMEQFESLYPRWLNRLRAVVNASEQADQPGIEARLGALDEASAYLRRFLQSLPADAVTRARWV